MYSFAQTNIQLLNQLQHEGYSHADICCIFNTYNLTIHLFSGAFRPSGKTFISHLVSTASILVSIKANINIIAAGLIHAAYEYGDFGDGKIRGISNHRREIIKQTIGKEVEEYVARYFTLHWDEKNILNLYNRLDTLAQIDKDVLLIRIANELEEYLDFGMIYSGVPKQKLYSKHSYEIILEMAERLGQTSIAMNLEKAIRESAQTKIPIEYCNQNKVSSFRIISKSYQKRFPIAINHYLINVYNYLRSNLVKSYNCLGQFIGKDNKLQSKN